MEKTLIIAEAGVNHNGDMGLAMKLIEEAHRAGADIVKFQTGKPENVASRFADKAQYQKETTGGDESQLDMIKKITLDYEAFYTLKEHCEKVGIGFLSTPFDVDSVRFLGRLVDTWKIPSGEITNLPYLLEVAANPKPVIMSTGMSDMDEIRAAVGILRENGISDITLLHCNTQYPTPYCDVNLNAMLTIRRELNVPVGYSDHTPGIEVPVAAVAMGACVIEKHFTLDRNMEGPDHKASLEPDELGAMVRAIRHVELAMEK